jgi:dihydrofolate reductase
MGRTTYETVLGFGGDWPYSKPVFVLSTTLTEVPEHLNGKVNFLSGAPAGITKALNDQGYNSLYIDGGAVVQSFLNAGLIDRMFITRVHTVLGGGTSLFENVQGPLKFTHIQTKSLGDAATMSEYERRST